MSARRVLRFYTRQIRFAIQSQSKQALLAVFHSPEYTLSFIILVRVTQNHEVRIQILSRALQGEMPFSLAKSRMAKDLCVIETILFAIVVG